MFIFFYSFFSPFIVWQFLVTLLFSFFYNAVELLLSNLKELLNANSKLIPYLGRKQGLYFSVLVIHYITMLFFFLTFSHKNSTPSKNTSKLSLLLSTLPVDMHCEDQRKNHK